MNLHTLKAGTLFTLAVLVAAPYAASAAAVIDLGMAATATAPALGVEAVETRFNETGKFLALMPLKLAVVARVMRTGEVTLSYPWYGKLTIDRKEKLATELKVAADNALRTMAVGTVGALGGSRERFTPEEAAAVTAAVNRVLEENFGADAD
jgi:hypothetical protein